MRRQIDQINKKTSHKPSPVLVWCTLTNSLIMKAAHSTPASASFLLLASASLEQRLLGFIKEMSLSEKSHRAAVSSKNSNCGVSMGMIQQHNVEQLNFSHNRLKNWKLGLTTDQLHLQLGCSEPQCPLHQETADWRMLCSWANTIFEF